MKSNLKLTIDWIYQLLYFAERFLKIERISQHVFWDT